MRKLLLGTLVVCSLIAGFVRADSACDAQMKEAMSILISEVRPSEQVVLVVPAYWDAITFSKRQAFAIWASHCLFGDSRVSIRHGMTGRELATYSRAGGYSSKE